MKKKMTAHSITLKHKKAKKMGTFAANRREEEMEDDGKAKHYKHMKHMKHKKHEKMACKTCGSTAHAMHPAMATKKHEKHEKHMKHMKKKSASLQTNAARFERMRKKVFGLK